MQGHRLLEHTADIGIEATAADPESLFAEAARALLEVLGGPPGRTSSRREIHLQGGDREDLLVRWLGEILFLLEARGFYPATFTVSQAGPFELRAQVGGEPYDPDRHPLAREVKAVTYHRLEVRDEHGGWRARVYLDL